MKAQIISYIRAGCPALLIVSHEETRIHALFREIAKERDFTLHSWSCTTGLLNIANGTQIPDTEEPIAALDEIKNLPEKSLILLNDFHQWLIDPNPLLVRKLKDVMAIGKMSSRMLVIIGCQLRLPPELEKSVAVIDFPLPDRAQLRVVLEGVAKSAGIEINGNTDAILDAASGLITSEAEEAFALSFVECGDITPEIIARQKAQTIRKNGILEIVETSLGLDDIGGLQCLKSWLTKRRLAFSKKAADYGLPVPKGVLVTGIPGVGKSLTAKAAAKILGVPLLKLEAGKIFGSLVGASEANMRTVIQTAEAAAPCVLWADEIEKGFSGSKSSGSTDGGTSSRVFGQFLNWMNEKTSPVFVFATANDISQLPPEFLRKGRFDELFFADLPDEQDRADIWRLHIAKRGRNPDKFDLATLANMTAEFTGAEIEAAVNEGLFAAFDENTEVADKHLVDAISCTVPLSRTMATQITALREWARGRARRASAAPASQTGTFNRKMT